MDKRHKSLKGKSIILLISLILTLCGAVGTTLAFVISRTNQVENTFNGSKVTVTVVEEFPDAKVKKNVQIENTGDVDVYIRVKLNFTWISETDSNTVYSTVPVENTDYTISYGDKVETTENTVDSDPKWIKGNDGFWYYTSPVAPSGKTEILIGECKLTDDANIPDGYTLSVNVISSAIQSTPVDAVESAWKVSVNNGILSVATSEVDG